MVGRVDQAVFAASQMARVGVYWGQYVLSKQLTRPVEAPHLRDRPYPSTRRILADLARLLRRDWANIRAGYYRMPHDFATAPVQALARARDFFADLPAVERRRHARRHQDVFREPLRGRFPRYYLQNFHYQTGGYLSRKSARLYDHQVEVLFGGAADAMRRQALVPLYHALRGRRQEDARLVDLACGTGRFLTFVKDNYPRLPVTALDLSPHYLAEARVRLRRWHRVEFVQARAEETGLADAAFDVAVCIYLFHELPRKVRAQVAREAARILRPGGLFILVDSVQHGDLPDYEGLLDYFPIAFHEPYYEDYARSDLVGLFAGAGLRLESSELAYLSRVMSFRKPALTRSLRSHPLPQAGEG